MSGREMPPDFEPSPTRCPGPYLIRRGGSWLLRDDFGSTHVLADAGVFSEREANAYLAAKGVTIHHAAEVAGRIRAEVAQHRKAIARLEDLARRIGDPIA